MLQPGMCSATWSLSSTWVGPPGDAATQAAVRESSGGGRFGPPTATKPPLTKLYARYVSQSGSTTQSESVKATISPVAASMPTLRAALSPRSPAT